MRDVGTGAGERGAVAGVGCEGEAGEVGVAVGVGFLGLSLILYLSCCNEFGNGEFGVVVCAVCLEGWGCED